MRLDTEFFKNKLEIIERFKNCEAKELTKIIPKWADGSSAHKIRNSILHPVNGEYIFVAVCLKSLVANSNFCGFDLLNLFTGDELNDNRVGRILFHWERKGYLDPPQISIGSDDIISFTDGRHRTKCALFLGQDEIPVAIHKSELPQLQKVPSLKAALL